MSYAPGDTLSIWVGEDRVSMINQFDSYYRLKFADEYGIGDQIKESMALRLAVDQALDQVDVELDERAKRAYVRQLILDDARD